ncbi:hypothetical protein [Xanthobacter sp. ZOL 2024]
MMLGMMGAMGWGMGWGMGLTGQAGLVVLVLVIAVIVKDVFFR